MEAGSDPLSRLMVRQVHRWLGIVLTLSILANVAAMMFGPPPPFIVYAPLALLALLLASGLYMFFLPYVGRKRRS